MVQRFALAAVLSLAACAWLHGTRELRRATISLLPAANGPEIVARSDRAVIRCPYSELKAFASGTQAFAQILRTSRTREYVWSVVQRDLDSHFAEAPVYEATSRDDHLFVGELLEAGLCVVADPTSGIAVSEIQVVAYRRSERRHEFYWREFLLPDGSPFFSSR